MSLAQRFTVGRLTCWTLEAGLQRLDGGAMFGVVPKPLWERRIPADQRNRIPLAMRCLLVEHPGGLVLVDSGAGNKENDKFIDIYGLANRGSRGPTQLEDAILETGHRPEEVRYVVNTHLHFDHGGGNTVRRPDGSVEPSFPGARYVVQRGELEFASTPNERIRASYLEPNYRPVAERGAFLTVDGEQEVLPGLLVLPTPGHVPFHQSVLVSSEGSALCFLGDLVPTAAHLPPPWIMGYDLAPLVTLETKKALLGRAAREGWELLFEHDPVIARGRVAPGQRGYDPTPVDTVLAPSLPSSPTTK